MTLILYLIGKAGSGKFTIAQNFIKQGFIVVDNQLINNPIFSLLNLDQPIPEIAWNAIETIRKGVFDFIASEKNNNYILTNELYNNDYDCAIYEKVKKMALKRSSLFIPIKLHVTEKENIKRIQNPERKNRLKTIKPNKENLSKPLISISDKNLLEIDITNLSAHDTTQKILDHLKSLI